MRLAMRLAQVLGGAGAGVAVLWAAACGDATPLGVAPAPDAGLLAGSGNAALVACSPLPHDSNTVSVGPQGGAVPVGPHVLTIPPGALAEPTAITAVAPSESVNRIQFGPAGLVFQEPASLSMSHANCGLLAGLVAKRIVLVDDPAGASQFGILEILPSVDNLLDRRVTASVSHFSSYAIAW